MCLNIKLEGISGSVLTKSEKAAFLTAVMFYVWSELLLLGIPPLQKKQKTHKRMFFCLHSKTHNKQPFSGYVNFPKNVFF